MSTNDNHPRSSGPRGRGVPSADISEDDLARDWTLSADDFVEITHARGADHRRRFALQLCMLRNRGRFLDHYRQASLKVVNHLSRQLGLPPVLFLDRPGRAQTERAQELRIRRYLGLGRFDRKVADNLRAWLGQGAVEGRGNVELLVRAEEKLRDWRIMLPAASTLERIVAAEATHAAATLFDAVTNRLPENLRASIDLLLEVPEGGARSSLFRLKSYPKSANAAVIKGDIVRFHLIEELLGKDGELADLDPRAVRQLGELGRRYDAGDLRRFARPKRTALIACYLVEARKTLLDQIVGMHDLFLTGMNRQSRTSVEKKRKTMRRRARDGLHQMPAGVDALAAADKEQTVGAFREAVNALALVEAATACRAYERLETRGHLDAMLARYSTLRQYLPGFITLPFQAAAGSETLLQAIEILRALDAGTRGPLTAGDPQGFVPADWRPHLTEDGKPNRHIWEISLAMAVRDALRAGSLFLSQSRDHVSFWSLIHDDRGWQANAAQAYKALNLPADPKVFLAGLTATFDAVARAAADGLAGNRFAAVHNGRLKLKRTDALPVPRELAQLRLTFQASYPRVRIEDLLQDVDEWRGFSQGIPAARRLPAPAAWQPPSHATRHRHRPRHQSRSRGHEPEPRYNGSRGIAGHQPMVPARGNPQGGQRHPGRLPSSPAVQPHLGRWQPFILRRPAFRRAAR